MQVKPNTVLCVHQGYELYGSDRVFIQSIKVLTALYGAENVTVHLPQEGMLKEELQHYTKNFVVGGLFIVRRSTGGFRIRNISALIRSLLFCARLIRQYDIIYINTVMVLPYLLLSRFFAKKIILHVHEIPYGPANRVFNFLVSWSKAKVIANSQATAANLLVTSKVVYNGIQDVGNLPKTAALPLKLLVVGRLNSWKGQKLLLEALHALNNPDILLRIVGGYFENQSQYYEELKEIVQKYCLQSQVEFYNFSTDISGHYQWADILVVPSLKPEPFGLVAIEGMCFSLPVIAADHGGLPEIVVTDKTGLLFAPGKKQALAQAIQTYLTENSLIEQHGANGRQRFLARFTELHYLESFITMIKEYVS